MSNHNKLSLTMKHNLLLFLGLIMICCLVSPTLPAQGFLNKMKDKAKQKANNAKDKAKRDAENEAKKSAKETLLDGLDALDQKITNMQGEYDSTNFSFAIALSDDTGLFEYNERNKRLRNLVVGGTDAISAAGSPVRRAKTYNELGQMSYANYHFRRAEFFFKASQKTYENNGEINNIYYPKLIANMGLLYHTMGRYTESLEFTQNALDLRENLGDGEDAFYAVALNNMAMLNRSLGKYNEAEAQLNEALGVIQKTQGKQSIPYAIMLNNKAMLFQTIGRYDQAVKLMDEVIVNAAETMREKSNNFQKLLVNQALLYQDLKKYEEAAAIYDRAIQIKERRLGTRNHPDLAHMLNLKASLYTEMGKNEEVEPLLLESLRIYEVKFGKEHPSYANTANNLGNFYRMQDKLNPAEAYLTKALDIRKEVLGETHPQYAETLEDLALVHWQKGNNNRAGQLYRQVIDKYLAFIRDYFPPMSEAEKEKYWDKLRPSFLRFYSFATDFHTQDPQLVVDMYNAHAATKGILLTAGNRIREEIFQSKDDKLIEDYKAWVDLRESLALYYSYSKEELVEDQVNLDSLERATNTLEKSISQRVPELFSQEINFQDVQNSLDADETFVDMIHFYHFDKEFTDQVYYAAMIINKISGRPELVLLENGNDLEGKYFKYYRNVVKNQRPDKYSYAQYWSKIDPLVKAKKNIYLSLDGVYTQVGINTLQKPDGSYIVDNSNLVFLTSAKDLKAIKDEKTEAKIVNVLLIGEPDYGDSGKIPALPGTKIEVDKIQNLLKQKGYTTQKYVGQEASEGAVKQAEGYQVLHIATHGFFMEDAVSTGNEKLFGIEIDKAQDNPLLRAGLMLANSEQVLDGTYSPEGLSSQNTKELSIVDNGILTAYEASNLSLNEVELVVLSACETGLGEVKAGEGVYGLQRAFHLAGAEALIMSLWTVSDAATQELMTLFYNEWLNSGNKVQAFRAAQLALKEKYPEPYFWGAFLLIGS